MLMEALAAIADELSYFQDHVAAEAVLPTAQQRLSLIRHARLVDYEPMPATAATTILQLDVAATAADEGATGWTIEDALRFRALHADGSLVEFEVEDPALGLAGMLAGPPPAWATVDHRWNRGALAPYWWDDSTRVPRRRVRRAVARGRGYRPHARPAAAARHTGRELRRPAGPGAGDGGRHRGRPDALRDVALTRVDLAAPTALDHDLALHRDRRQPRPRGAGGAADRDVRRPARRRAVERSARRPPRRELDRRGSARGPPLLPRRRAPSPGWRRPRRRSTPRSPLHPRSSCHRAPPTTPGRRGATCAGCSTPDRPTASTRSRRSAMPPR